MELHSKVFNFNFDIFELLNICYILSYRVIWMSNTLTLKPFFEYEPTLAACDFYPLNLHVNGIVASAVANPDMSITTNNCTLLGFVRMVLAEAIPVVGEWVVAVTVCMYPTTGTANRDTIYNHHIHNDQGLMILEVSYKQD